MEGHEEAVLDGASSLIATRRPMLMIEPVEPFNPGVIARLHERFAALSHEGFSFSQGALRPIIETPRATRT